MLEVRLFLAALIHYSSFTKSGHYIYATSLNSVLEIEKIASSHWCKLLLDHMKNGFIALEKSGTVWSPIFFLDNLDWAATTSNDPMKTPRLQYYTKSVLDKFVDLLKDNKRIKLKPWDRTVYAHKGIPKVQPDQIEYTVVGKDNVKKRSRSGKSGIGKTVEEEDCKKKGKSEKNKRPFQEEDDSFVLVPCMKKFRDDCLEEITSDKLIEANKIVEKVGLSWVRRVQSVTNTEMEHCASELKKLLKFDNNLMAKDNNAIADSPVKSDGNTAKEISNNDNDNDAIADSPVKSDGNTDDKANEISSK
uniref:Uncharacterized protein n=1 Tax=Oryza punctata TaxID=4537 RepID=A0A0E0KWU1_ORYPU